MKQQHCNEFAVWVFHCQQEQLRYSEFSQVADGTQMKPTNQWKIT